MLHVIFVPRQLKRTAVLQTKFLLTFYACVRVEGIILRGSSSSLDINVQWDMFLVFSGLSISHWFPFTIYPLWDIEPKEHDCTKDEAQVLQGRTGRSGHWSDSERSQAVWKETIRLSYVDRDKIWEIIARKITSVSHVPRSVKDVKHRWDDMKRRTKENWHSCGGPSLVPEAQGGPRPLSWPPTREPSSRRCIRHARCTASGERIWTWLTAHQPVVSIISCLFPAVQLGSDKELYYTKDNASLLGEAQLLVHVS